MAEVKPFEPEIDWEQLRQARLTLERLGLVKRALAVEQAAARIAWLEGDY